MEEYKKFKFQVYWNTACPLAYVSSVSAFVLRGQSRAVVTETHEAHRAWSIYYLALDRRSLTTPDVCDCQCNDTDSNTASIMDRSWRGRVQGRLSASLVTEGLRWRQNTWAPCHPRLHFCQESADKYLQCVQISVINYEVKFKLQTLVS